MILHKISDISHKKDQSVYLTPSTDYESLYQLMLPVFTIDTCSYCLKRQPPEPCSDSFDEKFLIDDKEFIKCFSANQNQIFYMKVNENVIPCSI